MKALTHGAVCALYGGAQYGQIVPHQSRAITCSSHTPRGCIMKQRFLLPIFALSFLFACNKDDSGTQPPPTTQHGAVVGKVVANLSGLPIPRATIAVESNPLVSSSTDSSGNFSLPSLSIGAYRFIVSKSDFISDTVSALVAANDTTTCNSNLVYLTPPTGLISYYRFDGNANDLGPGGNSGVVNNLTPSTDRFGNPNRAYLFSGSSSCVDVGIANTLNPTSELTICLWIKYNGGSSWRDIVSRWDVVNGVNERTYSLGILQSNRLRFVISRDGTDAGSTSIVDTALISVTGNWIHIAATWDGSTMRLFKNGNEIATGLVNGMRRSPNTRTGIGATLGRPGDPAISFFVGTIDDLRFYDRALTQQDIQTLYAEE